MAPTSGDGRGRWLTPERVALGFLVLGSAWIMLSDWAVNALFGVSRLTQQARLLKGLLFVAGVTALMYVLIARRDRLLRDREDQIEADRDQIEDLESDVRASERLLSVVLANITETVAVTDDAGRFTYVCENVHYVFGHSADEVRELGSVDALLGPELLPDRLPGDGLVENLETEITDADGRDRTVLVTVNPVSIRSGTRLYSVRDITELSYRLQQLRVMDRVLRHNLRNALNVIRGYAETLESAVDAPLVADVREIIHESDELLELTEKQREITKLLSSPSRARTLDLVPIVRRVADDLGGSHPEARIEVDLPDRASVSASPGIGRAIEELATNAVLHSDEAEPWVAIGVEAADGHVQVRVADDGPGIPEMERRVITGEHEIEPLYHGSGLGLWLVAWFARRSAGSIGFEDREGGGTLATLSLPATVSG